jgi:hypothetical protein
VETQLRIFRNGQPVFEDKFLPVPLDDQQDLKRLASGGVLQTGTALEPGEYILRSSPATSSRRESKAPHHSGLISRS